MLGWLRLPGRSGAEAQNTRPPGALRGASPADTLVLGFCPADVLPSSYSSRRALLQCDCDRPGGLGAGLCAPPGSALTQSDLGLRVFPSGPVGRLRPLPDLFPCYQQRAVEAGSGDGDRPGAALEPGFPGSPRGGSDEAPAASLLRPREKGGANSSAFCFGLILSLVCLSGCNPSNCSPTLVRPCRASGGELSAAPASNLLVFG